MRCLCNCGSVCVCVRMRVAERSIYYYFWYKIKFQSIVCCLQLNPKSCHVHGCSKFTQFRINSFGCRKMKGKTIMHVSHAHKVAVVRTFYYNRLE